MKKAIITFMLQGPQGSFMYRVAQSGMVAFLNHQEMIKCIKVKFTVVEGKLSKLSLTSVLMPGGE